MTEPDQDPTEFEARLRRSRPAKPPAALMASLLASRPPQKNECVESPRTEMSAFDVLRLLKWLVPGAAVALLAVAALTRPGDRASQTTGQPVVSKTSESDSAAGNPTIQADKVRIDQALVSTFDTIARLPGGEPVRFRCQEWMDKVVVNDNERGLIIENSQPRIEVAAVRFETY